MDSECREWDRRIALEVQYDGTLFNGWQIQKNGRTVQGEIERAIKILFKKEIRITASGRTDSGVHAIGQVVHFDTDIVLSLKRICTGLNGILPADVSIKNAFNVDKEFHSRFSAIERKYKYLIYNHRTRAPLMINRAMWIHDPLDVNYLREVAGFIVGEMDFASFCKKREAEKINTVRSINQVDIVKNGDLIEINVAGNAFLHNMIRIMIGTILDMFKRNAEPELIKDIIARIDREYSGKTAPPCGLYLMEVVYKPALKEMESSF